MTVGSYRKKPVKVEAMLFDGDNGLAVANWCGGSFSFDPKPSDPDDVARRVHIPTLEGVMTAMPGDYVIKGVKGEFYPCKPDIFAATYEPAGATKCEQVGHVFENKTRWCMVCHQDFSDAAVRHQASRPADASTSGER